ncbi:uncharacterized protein METZ01_LOCUS480752, partial [marine metagenome]
MEKPPLSEENRCAEEQRSEPSERRPCRRLFVHGLVLPCKIGIHRHERDAPQRVRISVDLDVKNLTIPHQDTIQEVINYDDIVAGVRDIVGRDHINLVESLA